MVGWRRQGHAALRQDAVRIQVDALDRVNCR
jgi:hypothetical protein